MHTGTPYYIVIAFLLSVVSCARHSDDAARDASGTEIPMEYASLLHITAYPGYTRVVITNPWDTSAVLNSYVLVPDTCPLPSPMPEGQLVRTPVKKAVVYSSVHQNMLAQLGASQTVAGVCDAEYVRDAGIKADIASGRIVDCGNNNSPDIERIILLEPDVLLASPYESSGTYGRLGQIGIPIVECADYMEEHPLGRAEWIRFYGMLTGLESTADSIFRTTADEYNRLRELAAGASGPRPGVLVDGVYGQGWTVPSGRSTTAIFIRDAGGINPFDYLDAAAGTTTLSPEQVLMQGGEADVWLYRYFLAEDITLSRLAGEHPVYSRLAPFKDGNVFGCNTARIPYYEEIPFRPHLLLGDLVEIFHPGVQGDSTALRYFTRLPQ